MQLCLWHIKQMFNVTFRYLSISWPSLCAHVLTIPTSVVQVLGHVLSHGSGTPSSPFFFLLQIDLSSSADMFQLLSAKKKAHAGPLCLGVCACECVLVSVRVRACGETAFLAEIL
jgi:hypothetical protein